MSYPRNNYHRRTRQREQPRYLTRAQEERRNAIADENYRRDQAAEAKRINDEIQARWDALSPEEKAERIANREATRAAMHEEAEANRRWQEQKRLERRDPFSTFGT